MAYRRQFVWEGILAESIEVYDSQQIHRIDVFMKMSYRKHLWVDDISFNHLLFPFVQRNNPAIHMVSYCSNELVLRYMGNICSYRWISTRVSCYLFWMSGCLFPENHIAPGNVPWRGHSTVEYRIQKRLSSTEHIHFKPERIQLIFLFFSSTLFRLYFEIFFSFKNFQFQFWHMLRLDLSGCIHKHQR